MDSSFAADAYAKQLGVTFPVLGDFPWAPIARAWGVLNEERGINRRITFVVGLDGAVQHIIDDPRDFPRHAEESLEVIKPRAQGGS